MSGSSFPTLTIRYFGQISSGGPDLHSGVDGGAAREPMMDMCANSPVLVNG